MKRFSTLALAILLLLGGAQIADAGRQHRSVEDAAEVQDAWIAWALGGDANPLLHDGFCGEVVGDRFFLNAAVAPGRANIDCEIPVGLELVATPAGSFGWRGGVTNESDDELFAGNMKVLKTISLKSIKVKVDGVLIPRGPMVCPGPIVVDYVPESFLAEVDPELEGGSTRVASCGWFYVLEPLGAGTHTVLISDKFKGEQRYEIAFSVKVV